MSSLLPAHRTKDVPVLSYHLSECLTFYLAQQTDGLSNGTALWLGAQILSLFLLDAAPRIRRSRIDPQLQHGVVKPRAIELGSGVGLTALTLASLGWDVLATDLKVVISSVLEQNIRRNDHLPSLVTSRGVIQVRELDWNAPLSDWNWDRSDCIASLSSPQSDAGLKSKSPTQVNDSTLSPPFDLILTSDTLYDKQLIEPLFRTISHLSRLSVQQERPKKMKGPPVFLTLENRDPELVKFALEQARTRWGFLTERIPDRKLTKMLDKRGVAWDRDEWTGVEVWKLTLSDIEASNGDLELYSA